MEVGLIDIEPKIYNTAYMQIARYHKDKGDTVEWWLPITHGLFDRVYCSSIFDFTDKSILPLVVTTGGTGFDIKRRLPPEIEACDYDYSIYPKCRASYLWFSRGCIRDCPWCVVPEKEGNIHTVAVPTNLNPNGEYIVVQDNNLFANKKWRYAIKYLLEEPMQPVDFQGVDVRILTKDMCHALRKLKHHKQIKIAWDNPREDIREHLKRVLRFIPYYQLMCYVLIGYDSSEAEDIYRVNTLQAMGISPFVMPYNRSDLYQRSFARWVNHKAIFKKVKWEDYRGRVQKQEAAGCGWRRIGNK